MFGETASKSQNFRTTFWSLYYGFRSLLAKEKFNKQIIYSAIYVCVRLIQHKKIEASETILSIFCWFNHWSQSLLKSEKFIIAIWICREENVHSNMKKVDNMSWRECRDQTVNEKWQNQTFKIASSDVCLKKETKMKVFKFARTIFTQTFYLWDLTKTDHKLSWWVKHSWCTNKSGAKDL